MPIARRRAKPQPHRPKLVDLGNIPLTSLNSIVPSDVDISRIKSSLTNATLQLKQLESNIARTQRRLDSFLARRDQLRAQTLRYHIAIAPYKRLPTEIMREIFVACMPETVHLPPRLDEAPLLLTRICSSWRNLALETQELWSTFEVALSTRAWRNNDALNALRCWLHRCPDRPLSFKINIAPRAPFPLPGICHPILPVDLIIPHSLKIRRLNLQNISGEQMNKLISLPSGVFPLLEEVDIFLRDSWIFRMEPPQEATAFINATRLHSVSIHGLDGTFNPVALNLPWNQLRTLHLETLLSSPIGCHAMLRLCTSLREVSLRVMRIEDSTSRLLGCVPLTHLPHLRSLAIRFESTAYYSKFLEPFVLPSLRSFQTRFDWRADDTITPTTHHQGTSATSEDLGNCYTHLILRSGCPPLERLHIGWNSIELDLGALLGVAKGLKELMLVEDINVTKDVWEQLGKGQIGGKLERLGISVPLVDPVLDMLEMRMGMAMGGPCVIGGYVLQEDVASEHIGERRGLFKEIQLGCPKPNVTQRWRMDRLEKLGLRINLYHYDLFER